MLARVVVHSQEDFDKWVKDAGDLAKSLGRLDPVAAGRKLYETRGCATCHSLEPNKVIIGPSFWGSWGETHEMADGQQVKVDENYVRESILYPQAKIRKGFGPVMPTFKGSLSENSRPADPNDPDQKRIPSDIDLIIDFLKSLK
jgi:cytochrome c oxidase subunit 2